MRQRYFQGTLFCLFAVLSWGGMFPVMSSALKWVNPFVFTAIRYTLAGILFLAFLVLKEGTSAIRYEGRALLAWVFGSLGFAGFGFLVFLGQKMAGQAGALSASVMMALMPLLSIVFNWGLRGLKPLRYAPVFVAMSFVGIITVVTKGQYSSLVHLGDHVVADLLILLGAACWVVYTIGATYFPGWSPLRYTSLTTVAGLSTVWVLNLVLAIVGWSHLPSLGAIWVVWPHLGYMVVLAGFLGVLCWNAGNRIITPINGILFMDVVPITTFTISAVQGYRFSNAELVGASLTISALICNNVYQRFANRPLLAPQRAVEYVSSATR